MKVTSLAEVWIEIFVVRMHRYIMQSLPLRKCGLKSKGRRNPERNQGHFPCGSVD